MPAIDYFGIEEAIKAVLEADAGFQGQNAAVHIEEEFSHAMTDGKVVFIYSDRRAPTPGQPIAAGQQTRYQIRHSIWSRSYSIESMRKAMEIRDDLLGVVETALMKNRSLNDAVSTSWLEGGEMMSGKVPGKPGFIASAETVLVVEKKTTTV